MAAPPADDPDPPARRPRRGGPEFDGPGSDGPDASEDGAADSLRGRVLVAGRHLRDPNFFRALVLLVEHGEDGAMGLVVNRPSDVNVREALAGHFEVGPAEPGVGDLGRGGAAVYCGGPVEPAALFVLHNSEAHAGGDPPLAPGLFAGNSREAFEGLVNAAGRKSAAKGKAKAKGKTDKTSGGADGAAAPVRYRVFAGCAGWGPGQLEDELARGDWRVLDGAAVCGGAGDPADPVFGPNPYAAWDAAARAAAPPPLNAPADRGDGFRWN